MRYPDGMSWVVGEAVVDLRRLPDLDLVKRRLREFSRCLFADGR